MHSMSTGQNPLLELSPDKQAELVQLVENGDLDSIADATGIDRRTVLKIGAALGVGSVAGGLSARELVQEARAAADTTDADGNVGLPGDRVDVFAEGIDSNSVSTGQMTIGGLAAVNGIDAGSVTTSGVDASGQDDGMDSVKATTATISFVSSFDTSPVVVTSVDADSDNTAGYDVESFNVSSSGFEIQFLNYSGEDHSAKTYAAHWIAIEV